MSPLPLAQEISDYFYGLIEMGPAGKNCKERVHFIYPENFKSFERHNMSLASLILYSPECMSRIKRLITGREAYMVSGVASKEDLALTYELGRIYTILTVHNILFSVYRCTTVGS